MIVASALRTGAQALIGFLVTFLATYGLDVPVDTQNWFVQTLIVGGGITVYTAVVRWLETREQPALRLFGQLLMLGISWQPTAYDSKAGTAPQK